MSESFFDQPGRWARFAREPLLHFALIGVLIYAAHAVFGESRRPDAEGTLVVSAGDVAWLEQSWQARSGRLPTGAERQALIDAFVRETILYREALAMGLDRDDVVIRRRLAQKLDFLTRDLAGAAVPDDTQLRAYFDRHRERYRSDDAITFSQVFFDPEKRGSADADAAEAAAALAEAAVPERDPAAYGDPFAGESRYTNLGRREASRFFGGDFAESIFELDAGRWHGPVPSGYGVHAVYVHQRREAPDPVFETVREEVLRDWTEERRREANDRFYAGLRARYRVVVED